MLEVTQLGELLDVLQHVADVLGVEDRRVRHEVDQLTGGGGLARAEGSVQPDDHPVRLVVRTGRGWELA